MVQIQEAGLADLMVRMVAAAARDHGPAVFVMRGTAEDVLIAHVVQSRRLPVELVTLAGPDTAAVVRAVAEGCGCDPARIHVAASLDAALFGKQAWITSRRAAPGNPVPPYEYNAGCGMLKFNPLAAWTDADVRSHLNAAKLTAPPSAESERLAA